MCMEKNKTCGKETAEQEEVRNIAMQAQVIKELPVLLSMSKPLRILEYEGDSVKPTLLICSALPCDGRCMSGLLPKLVE